MFDVGWSEILVIAVVAIIVVGPKELPRLMRTFGHYVGKLRHMAADFQRQFEEAMGETGLEEVRTAIEIVRDSRKIVDLNTLIGDNLMLPKQDLIATPYISSEAAAPNGLERAAPKPRRIKRKARKGSPPTNRTTPKRRQRAAP